MSVNSEILDHLRCDLISIDGESFEPVTEQGGRVSNPMSAYEPPSDF